MGVSRSSRQSGCRYLAEIFERGARRGTAADCGASQREGTRQDYRCCRARSKRNRVGSIEGSESQGFLRWQEGAEGHSRPAAACEYRSGGLRMSQKWVFQSLMRPCTYLTFLFLLGCGYQFAGRSDLFPKDIHSIYVEPFLNRTRDISIHYELATAL